MECLAPFFYGMCGFRVKNEVFGIKNHETREQLKGCITREIAYICYRPCVYFAPYVYGMAHA